ncbi:MAG: peptide chain release factor N(5)-glutamine methyltransferase [Pseudomonadota bacterium]
MSDARRAAVDALKAAGIENAHREARWLADHAMESGESLDALIERRVAGEPLQHIIGSTPFHAITLKTDARALIPRSDSETIVDLTLELIPFGTSCTIADLGAGTGALLLAILHQRPDTSGIAVEHLADAASLLRENISMLKMGERAKCVQGSWTDWAGWAQCDLVVSNPPYIQSNIIPTLAPEVRDHDPMEALDGGPDGLKAYREIIGLGAQHMESGAWLVLEIGYDQRDTVTELVEQHGFKDLVHRKDLGGNDRAIAARKP